MKSYENVYFNLYICGNPTGRQKILDKMAGGIPAVKCALNLICDGRPQISELSPHVQKIYYISQLHEFDLHSLHATEQQKE
jgi:hypothetical protein